MGLREQKRERQRQAIIDTAMELFAESGFEATRVRDIAQRLEISEPTFFNYFPTKQAVVDAAADHHLGRILEVMGGLDDDSPVLEQVVDLLSETAAIVMAEPKFAALFKLDVRFTLASGTQRQTYERLTGLLEAGQRRGEVRQDIGAGRLAEFLITSVIGTLSNRLLVPDADMTDIEFGTQLSQRLEETWAILCFGMKAPVPVAPTETRARAGRNRPR